MNTVANKQSKRVAWIDVAKGICIISVILGHFSYTPINTVVFTYHLTVFFLLSGYTMKESPINTEMLSKYFRALMVPYFFTGLCVALLDVWNTAYFTHDLTMETLTEVFARDAFATFVGSGGPCALMGTNIGIRIGAIWFLPAMFFCKIFAQGIYSISKNWLVRLLLALLAAVTGIMTAPFVWLPFSLQPALVGTVFVVLGRLFYELDIFKTMKGKYFLLSTVTVLLLWMYDQHLEGGKIFSIGFSGADLYDPILSILATVSVSILVMYLSKLLEKSRVLSWVGRNSLIFLCVHLAALNTLGDYVELGIQTFHLPLVYGTLAYTLFSTALHLLLGSAVTYMVALHKRWKEKRQKPQTLQNTKRDPLVDLYKAILIGLMLVAHSSIGSLCSASIYSFHMMAFVLFSGYFYKEVPKSPALQGRTRLQIIGQGTLKLLKTFWIPYCVYGLIYAALSDAGFWRSFGAILLGFSFTDQLFAGTPTVGPVYFIPMLFMVRLVYLIVDTFLDNRYQKAFAVLALSVFGAFLGKQGYWLPWSFDCALYALVFYYAGFCFKKIHLLQFLQKNLWIYFLISPIWVYYIYKGRMELALRNYGTYGLTVLGCICGILTVLILTVIFAEKTAVWLKNCLCVVGRSTLYILMVHTLFVSDIEQFFCTWLHLSMGKVPNLFLSIILQFAAGVLIYFLVHWTKVGIKKLSHLHQNATA